MTGGVVSTRRKITADRGRPSDCGIEVRKEDAGRNPPEDETAEPSTETPEMGGFDCEVFISFRGKDTRKGFTSHLHKELESRGISTFIDSERLEKGRRVSDLFKWIEGSKIFMPIFSKNYAESKWCLGEIAKMVEINKREGDQRRPIIPIFYDKNFRASFEEAFESHQHNIELGEEQINEWKVALTEAGKISGYCLSLKLKGMRQN
ncbi:TMV resistance protein [Nymphaea thermarum]|nr:TMV resistance protein [Nymphaea thermarum]